VGYKGKVMGLNRFGDSAPASVLDEKFGFTTKNVVQEILKYIEESK
jgi:transketolase